MERVEAELRALIARHVEAHEMAEGPGALGYSVAIPELLNILEAGSAPMLPADRGHAATCGICMPLGDGVSSWRRRRAA